MKLLYGYILLTLDSFIYKFYLKKKCISFYYLLSYMCLYKIAIHSNNDSLYLLNMEDWMQRLWHVERMYKLVSK